MTIGEIAEKTNLQESTLRYYEKKGLIKVARDENGRRNYEEAAAVQCRSVWGYCRSTGSMCWNSRRNGKNICRIWMIKLVFIGGP